MLSDRQGTLAEQLNRRLRTERRTAPRGQLRPGAAPERRLAPFVATRNARPDTAAPDSEITVPKSGLAMTLAHGAGVRTPVGGATTYSLPPLA